MKYCTDCQFFSGGHLANLCKSPQNGMSLIDGSPTVRWAHANRSGFSEKHCGENAVFWVEKAVNPKKPWYKFWK